MEDVRKKFVKKEAQTRRPVLSKKGYCIKRGSISHVNTIPENHFTTVTNTLIQCNFLFVQDVLTSVLPTGRGRF